MATINGVEVAGDKSAHDFRLLDDSDKTEIDNGIERNREATEDNHEDIVRHRTDRDVHVTPAWKNSLVTKEILGLYWTAAQTADIINEISIAGGAKLVKVDVLPETGLEQTIYLVPKTDPQAGDIFNEYVWIDGKFEFIGTTKADLSGYFPITGGALTGNIIERNTDNDHLGISGSYWGHGAYLRLSGQNSGYGGAWYLSARDTEKSCDLIGSPSGVLSWGGKLVATEDDLANYFPKAGGQLSGHQIKQDTNNNHLEITGGTDYSSGPSLVLTPYNSTEGWQPQGSFLLHTQNNCDLMGKPDGSLTWAGKNVDVIEEQGDGYIRYSNGIQICWGSISWTSSCSNQWGSLYETSIGKNASYAKSFTELPSVSAYGSIGGKGVMVEYTEGTFATTPVFYLTRGVAIAEEMNCFVRYIAIGKWK